MLKKVIALSLALIMVIACMSACGSQKLTVDSVKKAGKLVIGTSPDFPPFESLSNDGKVEGIEIEIMELICQELGVTLEVKQMEYACSNCGKKMKKTDKFCNACGGAVVEREVAPAVAPDCDTAL